MKNTPIVVTAASVVALMSAHANAVPAGNAMDYTQAITIVSTSGSIFDGTGVGTGGGSFDTNGEMSVGSSVLTNIPAIGGPGVVVSSTVYSGSISGSTWTYSGTSQTTFASCTGNKTICANITVGTAAPTTGNPIFTVDILAGGAWVTSSTIAGLTTLTVDHGLAPVASGPGGGNQINDTNPIPTMSMYGIGITAIALFGAAARRLRASGKSTKA